MRDFPVRIPIGGIEEGKVRKTKNLILSGGALSPFYAEYPYFVAESYVYCSPIPGGSFFATASGSYVSQSVWTSLVTGSSARCVKTNVNAYVFDGTKVVEQVPGGTFTPLASNPGLFCLYNDATPVLAAFSSMRDAYWLGTPLGLEIGSLNSFSLDTLSGSSMPTGDMAELWRDFTPTFGITPNGRPVTSIGQIGEYLAIFTDRALYQGKFVDKEIFAFSDPVTDLAVSSHRQTFYKDGVCFVLSDSLRLYVVSNDAKLLYDFSKLDSSLPRPTSVLGVSGESVILDGYVFVIGVGAFGPMDPKPVGTLDVNGKTAVCVNVEPFDEESHTSYEYESDWLLRDPQGVLTSNTVAIDSLFTRKTKIAVEYVPDFETRRSRRMISSGVNVKPDSPVMIRRVGTNFSVSVKGEIRRDGRIGGGIARFQASDLRYVRGVFSPQE